MLSTAVVIIGVLRREKPIHKSEWAFLAQDDKAED